MKKIEFEKVKDLMIKKYKAAVIGKQQFKDAVFGRNRSDIADDILNLTEGVISSENTVFYIINKVDVINRNCKCLDSGMYASGQTVPLPLSGFMPYIVFAVELSDDRKYMVNYAKWGSFADNISEELNIAEK